MGRGSSKGNVSGGGGGTPQVEAKEQKQTAEDFAAKYGKWTNADQLRQDFGLEDASEKQITASCPKICAAMWR